MYEALWYGHESRAWIKRTFGVYRTHVCHTKSFMGGGLKCASNTHMMECALDHVIHTPPRALHNTCACHSNGFMVIKTKRAYHLHCETGTALTQTCHTNVSMGVYLGCPFNALRCTGIRWESAIYVPFCIHVGL